MRLVSLDERTDEGSFSDEGHLRAIGGTGKGKTGSMYELESGVNEGEVELTCFLC